MATSTEVNKNIDHKDSTDHILNNLNLNPRRLKSDTNSLLLEKNSSQKILIKVSENNSNACKCKDGSNAELDFNKKKMKNVTFATTNNEEKINNQGRNNTSSDKEVSNGDSSKLSINENNK